MAYDLWTELEDKRRELNETIRDLERYGRNLSEYESIYKKALRVEIFELHSKGVAWTACRDLAHGETEKNQVNQKKFNRDLADTLYSGCQEKINSIKLQMRIIESQLNREWSVSK